MAGKGGQVTHTGCWLPAVTMVTPHPGPMLYWAVGAGKQVCQPRETRSQGTHVFPPGFLQRVGLFQLPGLVSKLFNTFFHFFVFG